MWPPLPPFSPEPDTVPLAEPGTTAYCVPCCCQPPGIRADRAGTYPLFTLYRRGDPLSQRLTLLLIDLQIDVHGIQQWRGQAITFRPQQQIACHLIGFDIKTLS